jgi:hypothetical protein
VPLHDSYYDDPMRPYIRATFRGRHGGD